MARRNMYGYFGDRLGVGFMGIIHRGSVLDDYDCDIIFDSIYLYIKFQSFQKMVLSYVQILVHFAGLRHFNDEFHWTDSCSFFQGRWMSVRAGGKHPFGGLQKVKELPMAKGRCLYSKTSRRFDRFGNNEQDLQSSFFCFFFLVRR